MYLYWGNIWTTTKQSDEESRENNWENVPGMKSSKHQKSKAVACLATFKTQQGGRYELQESIPRIRLRQQGSLSLLPPMEHTHLSFNSTTFM